MNSRNSRRVQSFRGKVLALLILILVVTLSETSAYTPSVFIMNPRFTKGKSQGKLLSNFVESRRHVPSPYSLQSAAKSSESSSTAGELPAATTKTPTAAAASHMDATGISAAGGQPPFAVTLDDATKYSYADAIERTLGWVSAAIVFGGVLWAVSGSQTGQEFFAGYLVEQSLSVDNLFVFLVLFEYFKVPLQYQDRVLNWGIYGAIVMRAVMIGLGAAALQNFHAILLVFAGILVYSSASFFIGGGDKDEEDPSENSIVQFSKSLINSSDHFDGDRFFTLVEGVRQATPLFICMIAVEISDVVFAVDSIPAVFGVTEVNRREKMHCRRSLHRCTKYLTPCHRCLPRTTEPTCCFYIKHICNNGLTKFVHDSVKSCDGFEVLGTGGCIGLGFYWC